jgi:hypothetical protein
VSHGGYRVSATACHVKTTTDNKLYSVASKDSLEFFYGRDDDHMVSAFKMSSTHTHYLIVFDKDICAVYDDYGHITKSGFKWWKHTRRPCLHVLFREKGQKLVEQMIKPHGVKKFQNNATKADEKNYEKTKCSSAYIISTKDSEAGAGIVGEYNVKILIQHGEPDYYDADFLGIWADQEKWFKFTGNYWRKRDKNYVHATDDCRVLVEYVPPSSSSSSKPSRLSTGEEIIWSGEMDLSDGVSKRITIPLRSDADFSNAMALGAPAAGDDGGDVAPKPLKRVKKLKFSLQPGLDAAEPGAGE